MRFPFEKDKALIGTIHLAPLPGSRGSKHDVETILDAARADAAAYVRGGVDGLIVENFGDAPFAPGRVEPHTVAYMALIVRAIRDAVAERKIPVGVNVLRNDGLAALGIARAAGAPFVRINVLTGVVATDQGIVEGRAHDVVRYRELIGGRMAILADVHVKHGRTLHSDDIAQAAHDTFHRGGADALIVTGAASGAPPDRDELLAVKNVLPDAPLIAGSGLNPYNAPEIFAHARAAIVGTWCKEDGEITAPVDQTRVEKLVAAIESI